MVPLQGRGLGRRCYGVIVLLIPTMQEQRIVIETRMTVGTIVGTKPLLDANVVLVSRCRAAIDTEQGLLPASTLG